MTTCPDCGSSVDSSASYCRQCGGTFDGPDPDSPSPTDPETLVERARHDSVTLKRLTELTPGGSFSSEPKRYLYDAPLVDYLDPDERPAFVFAAKQKGVQKDGSEILSTSTSAGMAICFTEGRLLLAAGHDEGDETLSLPYASLADFETSTGRMKHRVSLTDDDGATYDIYVANYFDAADIEALDEFLTAALDGATPVSPNEAAEKAETADTNSEPSSSATSVDDTNSEHPTVAERGDAIAEYLDADETPEYVLKGKSVTIKRGDDEERKSGKRTYAAVTDRRILTVTEQRLSGDDTRSIPYDAVDGVNLDSGIVNNYLSVQASGQTYKINTHDDGDVIDDAISFIRDQRQQANASEGSADSGSEPDPTEQLKNLKELHEQGVLTDEEFSEKKQSLLDKI